MDDESTDREELDARLEELARAKSDAIDRCHYRTAARLASEIRRTAKAARRLRPYVWALHTLMNHASSLLDPEPGREAAVELIAVLESEELARQIQPDIDPAEREQLVAWVSSCAYDGLGHTTASSRGYNSDGVHDTIAEGIQVCRRTGKLECIACFRGYATEVSRAADDLEMALHHSRQRAAGGEARRGVDRRWSGAHDEARLLVLAGRVDLAEAAADRASGLVDTYHSPALARLDTGQTRRLIRLLRGADGPPPGVTGGDEVPADEYPRYRLEADLIEAIRLCLAGDPAAAIRLLADWDRRLDNRGFLDLWFEVRLRLVAASRLAGDDRKAHALARPLEAKAREARDWLTLRRLARLLDPDVPASPIAPAGPIVLDAPAATAPAGPPAADDAEAAPGDPVPTPLDGTLDAIVGGLQEAPDDPAARGAALDALLALGPDAATDPADVARMLAIAAFLGDDPARREQVWDWAERIAAPFPADASALNLLAHLGAALRGVEGSPAAGRIDAERVERMFGRSLDLDPDNPANYGRAALYYHRSGRINEAERCLARWLRLDRGNARAALWLAELYNNTDRSGDALAVLDMALRSGSDAPDVAWQASVLAHAHGQFEAMLTYLDRFESLAPGQPWAHYYRASGLLRLGRPAEAPEALDEEERRHGPGRLHVLALRACAAAALGQPDEFRARLAEVLAVKLSGVDYLTHQGLIGLCERLWDASAILPDDDPELAALADRLLATGLAPNGLFGKPRKENPRAEGLNFYAVAFVQPLDGLWPGSDSCLAGEADWAAYRIAWGVLAGDEAEAARVALSWQARCHHLRAAVEDVRLQDEGYADHPGVVWQGLRSPEPGPT